LLCNPQVKETLKDYIENKGDDFKELCQAILKTKALVPSETHKSTYIVERENLEEVNGKAYAKLIPMQNGVPQVGMSFTKYTDLALRLRLNEELKEKEQYDKEGNLSQIQIIRPSEPTNVNTFASYAKDKQVVGLTGSAIVDESHENVQVPAFKASLRQDEIYFTEHHQGDHEQQRLEHNQLIVKHANELSKQKNLIIHVSNEEEGNALEKLLANKAYTLKGYYGSRKDSEDERAKENQDAIDFLNPDKNNGKNNRHILITSVLNRGSDFKAGAVNELKTYFSPNKEDMEGSLERMKQELGRVARAGSAGQTVSVIRFEELYPLLYRPLFSGGAIDLAYLKEIARHKNPRFLLQTLQHLAGYVDEARVEKRQLHALKSHILAQANESLYANNNLNTDARSRLTQFLQKTLEGLSLENQDTIVGAINQRFNQDGIDKIEPALGELKESPDQHPDSTFIQIQKDLVAKVTQRSDTHWKINDLKEAKDLQALIKIAARVTEHAWTRRPTTLTELEEILRHNKKYLDYLKLKSIPADFERAHLLEYADKGFVSPVLAGTDLYQKYERHYKEKYIIKGAAGPDGNNSSIRRFSMLGIGNSIDLKEALDPLYDLLRKNVTAENADWLIAEINKSARAAEIITALQALQRTQVKSVIQANDNEKLEANKQAVLPLYAYLNDHEVRLSNFIDKLAGPKKSLGSTPPSLLSSSREKKSSEILPEDKNSSALAI
jgi:hypothetical protein